jgi:hypothetical protein
MAAVLIGPTTKTTTTVDEIVEKRGFSRPSILTVIHKDLQFKKSCAVCLPPPRELLQNVILYDGNFCPQQPTRHLTSFEI